MIKVALKGLLGRKLRAALTALAIVLGVAMVSGTFVLTDTIQKAFDGVFASSYRQTNVVVSGREIVKGSRQRGNLRTYAEVEPYFDGLELAEPGITRVPAWRPGCCRHRSTAIRWRRSSS